MVVEFGGPFDFFTGLDTGHDFESGCWVEDLFHG